MNIKDRLKKLVKLFSITSSMVLSISLSPHASADSGSSYSVYDTDRDRNGFMDRKNLMNFLPQNEKVQVTRISGSLKMLT